VHAGQQFARVEGLAQVVVGADFEADDAVDVLALGGEHDDRGAVVGRAQAAADRQAVLAGHHQVEHDQVDRVAQQDAIERLAVLGHDHFEPFLRQVAAQQVADAGVVVDDHDLVGASGNLSHFYNDEFVTAPILKALTRHRAGFTYGLTLSYKTCGRSRSGHPPLAQRWQSRRCLTTSAQ
jgi:hypothetical protein